MYENYEKRFFSCSLEEYVKVQQAMQGLRAMETETTFDRFVYFYVLIDPKDLDEFNRRLQQL